MSTHEDEPRSAAAQSGRRKRRMPPRSPDVVVGSESNGSGPREVLLRGVLSDDAVFGGDELLSGDSAVFGGNELLSGDNAVFGRDELLSGDSAVFGGQRGSAERRRASAFAFRFDFFFRLHPDEPVSVLEKIPSFFVCEESQSHWPCFL